MQEEKIPLFLDKLSCYLALQATGHHSSDKYAKAAYPEETAQSQITTDNGLYKGLLLTFPLTWETPLSEQPTW